MIGVALVVGREPIRSVQRYLSVPVVTDPTMNLHKAGKKPLMGTSITN